MELQFSLLKFVTPFWFCTEFSDIQYRPSRNLKTVLKLGRGFLHMIPSQHSFQYAVAPVILVGNWTIILSTINKVFIGDLLSKEYKMHEYAKVLLLLGRRTMLGFVCCFHLKLNNLLSLIGHIGKKTRQCSILLFWNSGRSIFSNAKLLYWLTQTR